MSIIGVTAVVVGPDDHGVVRHALTVARATGTPVVRLRDPDRRDAPLPVPTDVVHLHVTDRLFGADVDTATARLLTLLDDLGVPAVLSLHDVPGPGDDDRSRRRRRAYRRIAARAAAVVVTADHERRRLLDAGVARPIRVVPFPIEPTTMGAVPRRTGRPPLTDQLGVLGFVYPGKGHAVAIDTAARVGSLGVVALGSVSPGHDDLADELHRQAAARSVSFTITGSLDDTRLADSMASVAVPFAVYADVSASLSIVTWLRSGRRPVVAAGQYVAELAQLVPGGLTVVDADDSDGLDDAVRHGHADPARTHLAAADGIPGDHLSEAAIARCHRAVYDEVGRWS